MEIQAQLLQKHGLVAVKLAREFMTMQVGGRLNTIEEYARKYDAARGTVQAALKLLAGHGAVSLEPRGHLGTFITDINYEALWEFTGLGTIMGVMPLPYSKRYEGLATGLYRIFRDRQIPFSLAYMRGAETRLHALAKDRYDLAVVSRLAAVTAMEKGMDVEIAAQFGKYTYVDKHVLIFAGDGGPDILPGMKVGVDRSSIDHYVLTAHQCAGKKVQMVDLAYNQIIAKLHSGEIDAAIWNIDEIVERKLAIAYYPLKSNDYDDYDTEAVIVVNRHNYGIRNILSVFVDKAAVIDCQAKVVRGEAVPNY